MEKPTRGLALACPQCKGTLRTRPDAYFCDPCSRRYPVIFGIPDFRLQPDRYISTEDDRRKGEQLLDRGAGRGFADLLDLYWELTPGVPSTLVEKYKAHMLAEAAIAETTLGEIEAHRSLLDVGCSTGGLLVAASRRVPTVVGVDVAFRWLVIGQTRLREVGVEASLICANAEHLPFSADAFGTVTATDLIEHVVDPALVFGECRRVTAPGGVCYFSTNNRYSLLPEPHVKVWGVGWLPRALQASYAKLATGRCYRNIRLRSRRELVRWVRAAGFSSWRLEPAPLAAPRRGEFRAYNRSRRLNPLRWLLLRVGPRLQLVCQR